MARCSSLIVTPRVTPLFHDDRQIVQKSIISINLPKSRHAQFAFIELLILAILSVIFDSTLCLHFSFVLSLLPIKAPT